MKMVVGSFIRIEYIHYISIDDYHILKGLPLENYPPPFYYMKHVTK